MLTPAVPQTPDYQAAILAAFDATASRLPSRVSAQDFAASVAGWDCYPVKTEGQFVGAVLTSGPELHACIKSEAHGRWLSRALLGLIEAAVSRFGYAMTQASTDAGRQFVERLGFKATRAAPTVFLKVGYGH